MIRWQNVMASFVYNQSVDVMCNVNMLNPTVMTWMTSGKESKHGEYYDGNLFWCIYLPTLEDRVHCE